MNHSDSQRDEGVEIPRLPQDIEAEKAVLEAVMLDNRIIHDVAGRIGVGAFYDERHRNIWRAMMALAADDEAIDLLTIKARLVDQGIGDKVATRDILGVSNTIPAAANVGRYVDRLVELDGRRRIYATTRRLNEQILGAGLDCEEAVEELAAVIDSVSRKSEEGEADPSIDRHTKEWLNRLEKMYSGETSQGISTGIAVLDRLLGGGFAMQRMVGVAALPKMGKTKLALSILGHLALEHEFAADVWYTDGPGWAISRELIAWKSGVPTDRMEAPQRLSTDQWRDLIGIAPDVQESAINVYPKGTPHIRDIKMRTKARLSRLGDKPMVLVVDYLQNCTAGYSGPGSERLNITDCSRELAALRTDHDNLLVIVLLQFNREATKRDMPSWTDLYGASQLEKDLDHLLIFHRPAELDDHADAKEKRKGILWHALTKHGPTGRSPMFCDLSVNQFAALEDRYEFRGAS